LPNPQSEADLMVKCVECENLRDEICTILKAKGHFAQGRLAFDPATEIVCPDWKEKTTPSVKAAPKPETVQ